MPKKDKYVFVSDVDGCMTNGGMWYNKKEKLLKMFGADDHDAVKELMKFMPVQFITGDKRGFDITAKRIKEEMGCELALVSHKPKERWQWIKKKFPDRKIIFMGDGIYDFYSLRKADISITTEDALSHVKVWADFVTARIGGNRAMAEAILHVMGDLGLDWLAQYDD